MKSETTEIKIGYGYSIVKIILAVACAIAEFGFSAVWIAKHVVVFLVPILSLPYWLELPLVPKLISFFFWLFDISLYSLVGMRITMEVKRW